MTGNTQPARSKKARIGLWILAGLMALFFAGGALGKLGGSQEMIEAFQAWGYPAWFMYVVGAGEILGAALLLAPKTRVKGVSLRFWGAVGLAVIMVGAVGTHLVHAEYLEALLPLALFALLAGLAAFSRPSPSRET